MLKFRLFKGSAVAVLIMLMSMGSQIAFAGMTGNYPGDCFSTNVTTVYCYGNMADIAEQSADPYRFATFLKWSYPDNSTSLQFYMRVNNNTYSCIAPSSMVDAWNSALSSRSLFYVVMDTSTGVCTYVGSYNSSTGH